MFMTLASQITEPDSNHDTGNLNLILMPSTFVILQVKTLTIHIMGGN